jgi:hypothetical protein
MLRPQPELWVPTVSHMRVLFLHQNFPGQFVHLAQAVHATGNETRAITDAVNTRPDVVPTERYVFSPAGEPDRGFPLARSFSERVRRGETVARKMLEMREDGFTPDLVVGHFGWGETLFVKDVWPQTKLIVYGEYFYAADGGDADFDPEFQAPLTVLMRAMIGSMVAPETIHSAACPARTSISLAGGTASIWRLTAGRAFSSAPILQLNRLPDTITGNRIGRWWAERAVPRCCAKSSYSRQGHSNFEVIDEPRIEKPYAVLLGRPVDPSGLAHTTWRGFGKAPRSRCFSIKSLTRPNF